MHTRHVLAGAVALGLVAMLVPACVGTVDNSAPGEDPTTKEEQAFDASIFHFGTVVPDDGHDPSGGSQRAVATLGFWDGRQGIIASVGPVSSRYGCRCGSTTSRSRPTARPRRRRSPPPTPPAMS
jgi:hypothetical protein